MKCDLFRIKELRVKAGLTQAALAFALELNSPSTVTRIALRAYTEITESPQD